MRPSEALREKRAEVLKALARFNVSRPMIFGSVMRDEDLDGSDLDLILDLQYPATYYDVFRIEDELSDVSGVRVEVHTYGRPSSKFLARISREMKTI